MALQDVVDAKVDELEARVDDYLHGPISIVVSDDPVTLFEARFAYQEKVKALVTGLLAAVKELRA